MKESRRKIRKEDYMNIDKEEEIDDQPPSWNNANAVLGSSRIPVKLTVSLEYAKLYDL